MSDYNPVMDGGACGNWFHWEVSILLGCCFLTEWWLNLKGSKCTFQLLKTNFVSPRNIKNQYLVTRDDNWRRTGTLSTLLQKLEKLTWVVLPKLKHASRVFRNFWGLYTQSDRWVVTQSHGRVLPISSTQKLWHWRWKQLVSLKRWVHGQHLHNTINQAHNFVSLLFCFGAFVTFPVFHNPAVVWEHSTRMWTAGSNVLSILTEQLALKSLLIWWWGIYQAKYVGRKEYKNHILQFGRKEYMGGGSVYSLTEVIYWKWKSNNACYHSMQDFCLSVFSP